MSKGECGMIRFNFPHECLKSLQEFRAAAGAEPAAGVSAVPRVV